MSRKNVDLVLTGYEAWDRSDIETAFAPIDEDSVASETYTRRFPSE